jgi:hypothetical protein
MDNAENIDYGENSLNELFKTLDSKTKGEILRYPKEAQIEILKDIQNPELKNFWNKMPEKEKKELDELKVRVKYIVLKTKYAEFQEMKSKIAKLKNKENTETQPDVLVKDIRNNAEFQEMKSKIAKLKNKENTEKKSDVLVADNLNNEYLNDAEFLEMMKKNIDELKNNEQVYASYDDRYDDLQSLHSSDLDPERAGLKTFGVEYKNKNVDLNTKQKQEKFEKLINIFYGQNPFSFNSNVNHELEVKFGTKGIKPLTRNDYDNVVKKLKSSGFNILGEYSGEYYLRINCEFIDNTGKFKLSDVRTEIKSIHAIQQYCESNDLKVISPVVVDYVNKKIGVIGTERIWPLDFDDFNFRVSYQTEEKVKKGVQNGILENWRKSKKEFRFINRVTFEHPEHPFKVDISITKFGNRNPDKYGRENRGPTIRVYTITESNVFNNQENYEIEIEIDNSKIGPLTPFNTPAKILQSLRKVIKYVLSGLQGTNYPVSYPEQKGVIDSYMKMIWEQDYDPSKFISSKNFIGPNSITLQLKNIAPIDSNSNEPNIRKDFVVTDKADGERHLMYISNEGKAYLINTNMDVIFTGAKTNNKECFNALLDGELIAHDKYGKFINLYAAFDIYFFKKQDIRSYTFMLMEKEEKNDIYKSRYQLLKLFEINLKLVSITDTNRNDEKSISGMVNKLYKSKEVISPIKFSAKEFFPNSPNQSIFDGCNTILQKVSEGRFEYTTDGLIFSHAYYGVGSNEIGKSGSKLKITWEQSFKWKPPQYNTIDFLVTTVKGANGDDVINSYYEDGVNNSLNVQYSEYKTIELRCGFKESKDGFINPCQDIIDDKLPEFKVRYQDKQENDYVPMRFYPTEPYDPNAGICNIMLRMDGSGGKKMFSEENQVFEDNTIVEFRYDLDKAEGWKWIPLRVRYDKTAKLRRGEKEYGNAYKVCNENWKSIHPTGRITKDMLYTGLNIPSVSVSEDVYYNTTAGKFKTNAMKNFHNLYVKKKLIVGASKQGDTLIDFACGKAGDLPKWISAKLSFVFGIDISPDNLENRLDGACARFLNMTKTNKNVPYALFVNGNSAYNIKDGGAMLNDKAKQITAAIFGNGQKDVTKIGKGVARQYGKGADGFNVSSCQFAIHYFFKNPDTLKGFMKNIAECTKHNGYFIGTGYDGKIVFNQLKKIKTGESVKIIEDGKKIWEIIKDYGGDTFEDDSSSIGYEINVYQESINQYISEYLINFDYLNRVMSAYGFEIISQEEASEMGLLNGTGLFSELFLNMLDEIAKNKYKAQDYDQAPNMTSYEKKISFLNRYFVYKKIRTVNTEKVELELGEYQESYALKNKRDTLHAQEVAKEEVIKIAPKVRRLSKKLLLIAATEAIDIDDNEPNQIDMNKTENIQKPKRATKAKGVTKAAKPKIVKKLIIEDEDEN